MNQELLSLIEKLVSEIKNDKRYLNYKKNKEIIESDKELVSLYFKKEEAINKLNDDLAHFPNDLNKKLIDQKKIKEIQDELLNNKKIKEYLASEEEYNQIINLINEELFKL